MTQASLSPIATARKPREGTITATYGDRIAGARIDCRDIDKAVACGESILARAPVKDAARHAVFALLTSGDVPAEATGYLLAALVSRKLGKTGLHELRKGREVRFVFGPEEDRLRSFTAGPGAVH